MIVCDYVGVEQVVVWVFSSLRQQRRHHHTSYAGSPKGIDGDVSSGSCQVLLWDSAASHDAQPCGENTNIHKCSQIIFIILILYYSYSLLFIIQLYGYSNVVFNIAAVFVAVAGDGERHAGLS